jgi:hypothetical protein
MFLVFVIRLFLRYVIQDLSETINIERLSTNRVSYYP